jgi:hypothetical protein
MLRSFCLSPVVDSAAIAIAMVLGARRLGFKLIRRPIIRVLLARPLWWLGARMLALPSASAGYAQFRDRAMVRWENLLLDEDADQIKRS